MEASHSLSLFLSTASWLGRGANNKNGHPKYTLNFRLWRPLASVACEIVARRSSVKTFTTKVDMGDI